MAYRRSSGRARSTIRRRATSRPRRAVRSSRRASSRTRAVSGVRRRGASPRSQTIRIVVENGGPVSPVARPGAELIGKIQDTSKPKPATF